MSLNPNYRESIPSSEITPESLYLSRRDFIKTAALAASGIVLTSCSQNISNIETRNKNPIPLTHLNTKNNQDEIGNSLSSYEVITNYNNYYEFSLRKEEVAPLSQKFTITPWQVEVSGLVSNPKTYGLDDLLKRITQEERIYRLRCVEGWSMVIPWQGFPLSKILKEVQPKSNAKFVRFVTLLRPGEMEGQKDNTYPWPYQEGLRLDEAMQGLTILATGIYGNMLLPQNGAPIRLVVPWKYGFKSIKSIVKIELLDEQPTTFWSSIAPNEYGFYSNVYPEKPHPRWNQSSERRIGERERRATLLLNGYDKEVASLYKDLNMTDYY